MESEPSFEWSELEAADEQQVHVIALDLIIAHIEVFHPYLAELFYQEEENRIHEGRDNIPFMLTISGLITEMNLNRIVTDAGTMLNLSRDEYMRKRTIYLEYLRNLSQNQ